MNTKFLKYSLILLVLSAFFAMAAIYSLSLRRNIRLVGENVFARTIHEITDLERIIIETPQTTVTLEPENNLWRVREADGYYAGYDRINGLFNEFNSSVFSRYQQESTSADDEEHNLNKNGFRIITKTAKGEILNSVLIGSLSANKQYRFAKVANEPGVFLISGTYALPKEMQSWLQQPLLSLIPTEIRSLNVGGITASRPDILVPFKILDTERSIDINRYINVLGYISIQNVLQEKNFDTSRWPERKEISVTTFDGLIAKFEIYTDGQEYWTSLKISTTTLPTVAVNDYISNNAFRYDGWYFKLPPQTGKTLFSAYIE